MDVYEGRAYELACQLTSKTKLLWNNNIDASFESFVIMNDSVAKLYRILSYQLNSKETKASEITSKQVPKGYVAVALFDNVLVCLVGVQFI